MDNEERISAAEIEHSAAEKIREMARAAGAEVAIEGARAYHAGYRVGLRDAFFFAFALVVSAITVYTYMDERR